MNNGKRTIGIIGGLSPESTTIYYRTIVSEYRKRYGLEDYPEVIIYSLCFDCFRSAMRRGDSRAAIGMLRHALESLSRAGADLALIAANTPHIYFQELSNASSIPLISITSAVAERLEGEHVSSVGVIATKKTVEAGLYEKALEPRGIRVVYPSMKTLDEINRIIFRELARGIVSEKAWNKLLDAIEDVKRDGASAVVLACTELSLLVKSPVESIAGVKVYDSARIHAIKALDESLRKHGNSLRRG